MNLSVRSDGIEQGQNTCLLFILAVKNFNKSGISFVCNYYICVSTDSTYRCGSEITCGHMAGSKLTSTPPCELR